MLYIDPDQYFRGDILIAAPHMDDEVLACGGTAALLPDKERLHVVYATDGMRAPAPVVPWRDAITLDLGYMRMQEARAAMGHLGVPAENLEFLGLPEGRLKRHWRRLVGSLAEVIGRIRPSHILLPFRYDRHPDHLALNHAVMALRDEGRYLGDLYEYFVYYRYRLLPDGDIRAYIKPRYLLGVAIGDVSAQKRAALDRFHSQTTRFYDWQTRPNLLPRLLDEVSTAPEIFLRYDPSASGPAVFDRCVAWIRVAHRVEPVVKKRKDQLVALWMRGLHREAHTDG